MPVTEQAELVPVPSLNNHKPVVFASTVIDHCTASAAAWAVSIAATITSEHAQRLVKRKHRMIVLPIQDVNEVTPRRGRKPPTAFFYELHGFLSSEVFHDSGKTLHCISNAINLMM